MCKTTPNARIYATKQHAPQSCFSRGSWPHATAPLRLVLLLPLQLLVPLPPPSLHAAPPPPSYAIVMLCVPMQVRVAQTVERAPVHSMPMVLRFTAIKLFAAH